jgi:cytochrome c oxidase cbb3-type subunit 2
MAFSWLGFVLTPQLQLGRQGLAENKDTGFPYPSMRAGLARQGEQVYRANGCFYCHTEQARPKGYGSDVAREWGGRSNVVQNVAQDYVYDRPLMLGSQRVGPDLANIGRRQTNEMAFYMHLYDAKRMVEKSVMPPYRYLFAARTLRPNATASADALPLPNVATGTEIVPTDDARALVAYLMSLHSEVPLFEAPPPLPPPTNKLVGATGTNAPAASTTTNAPGTNSTAK